MFFVFLIVKIMSQSKTRYFKLTEIDTGVFHMLEDMQGKHVQTLQIPGLETRCKRAKRGFHFWVFLPDNINKVTCLACGLVVNLNGKPPEKTETPPNADVDKMGFATP